MKSVCIPVCAFFVLFLCGLVFGAGGILPGDGSAATPYQIEDLDDFLVFADVANAATYWASGVHTELTSSISLAGIDYSAAVIAPDTFTGNAAFDGTSYQGSFHGNGFEISDLQIDDGGIGATHVGLFGDVENGAIENLTVHCDIHVSLEGTISGRTLCFYGGLCGAFSGGSMTNCSTTGDVQVLLNNTGNAFVSDTILGAGGLCGSFYGNMSHCYSSCRVTTSASGYYTAANRDIGGLCGVGDGTISDSDASGAVSVSLTRFVGGYKYSNYSLDEIGGLCGKNSATLDRCFSSGAVECSSDNVSSSNLNSVGGLVGYNSGAIQNSYTISPVLASSVGDSGAAHCFRVGGLIGNNHSAVEKCYAAASFSVSATSSNYVDLSENGGLCGGNWSSFTGCFWDTDVSGTTESAGGEGKTTTEMMTESTFTAAGWDFDDSDGAADWAMSGGYPKLTWEPVNLVDFEEFVTLAQYWRMTGCDSSQPCAAADWHVDETIDIQDLYELAIQWLE